MLSRFFFGDAFGLDSIQGILELVSRENDVPFACCPKPQGPDDVLSNEMYRRFKMLENEGFIKVDWEENPEDNQVIMRGYELTIKGHLLLDELQNKSSYGRLRQHLADLIWIVITSIATTLVVIKFKGL